MTFVLSDIEGSTTLLRALGDDEYAQTLAEVRRAHAVAAADAGGSLVGVEGDAVLLAFASPKQAVRACSDVQAALAARSATGGATVLVRMGAHRGQHVRPVDGNYSTLAVHQAARVMAAANGGQVLVTDAVAEASRSRCRSLGLFVIRDFDEPIELYAVLDVGERCLIAPRALPLGAETVPRFRTGFLGREDELTSVQSALREHRLVTLVGPGGAGKTRLAVEAVRAGVGDWAGRWFVDLTSATPATVPDVFRAALGELAAGEPEPQLVLGELLRGRPAVMVVDNCEHVLDAAAESVDRFLSACPALHMLCTSRERLALPDERLVPLFGLGLPVDDTPAALVESPAGRLFLDRAEQVTSIHLDAASATALRAVVEDLDGLPLALELVAALAWAHPPAQLRGIVRKELAGAGRGASRGARGRPERHTSLATVIEWSVRQLEPAAVAALAALSLAVPPIAPRTAYAALSAAELPAEDVPQALEDLSRRSLIVAHGNDGSWRMLESIRLFCDGLPVMQVIREQVLAGLAADCISALGEPYAVDDPPSPELDAVAPTALGLLEAAEIALPTRQQLALGVAQWFMALEHSRLVEHCERALAMGDGDPELRHRLHVFAARDLLLLDDLEAAQKHLDAAAPLMPSDPAHRDVHAHMRERAILALKRGDPDLVQSITNECVNRARGRDRAAWLQLAALVDFERGEWGAAAVKLEEVLALSPLPNTLLNLANVQAWHGRIAEALTNLLRYLNGERRLIFTAFAAHVAATALTHERRWTPQTYGLVHWSFATLGTGWGTEAAMMAAQRERAESELTDDERAESVRIASELDERAAHGLMQSLALERLQELSSPACS